MNTSRSYNEKYAKNGGMKILFLTLAAFIAISFSSNKGSARYNFDADIDAYTDEFHTTNQQWDPPCDVVNRLCNASERWECSCTETYTRSNFSVGGCMTESQCEQVAGTTFGACFGGSLVCCGYDTANNLIYTGDLIKKILANLNLNRTNLYFVEREDKGWVTAEDNGQSILACSKVQGCFADNDVLDSFGSESDCIQSCNDTSNTGCSSTERAGFCTACCSDNEEPPCNSHM